MPRLGSTMIENLSLESVNKHSSFVTKAVTSGLLVATSVKSCDRRVTHLSLVASPLVTHIVTAFDMRTRVLVLTLF
jgi:hypothetical protein